MTTNDRWTLQEIRDYLHDREDVTGDRGDQPNEEMTLCRELDECMWRMEQREWRWCMQALWGAVAFVAAVQPPAPRDVAAEVFDFAVSLNRTLAAVVR